MKKKLFKILFCIVSFVIMISSHSIVSADVNDSSLQRLYYDGYYAVYDAPDRVRLFYAERYELNGDTAYCIQPGVAINTYTYSSTDNWDVTGLSTDVKNYIKLIAYYGYDYPGHQTMYYYFATQELIWEKISGRAVGWIYGEDRYGPQINIDSQKNEILNLANNHEKTPSFDETTIDMTLGETKDISDNNNVLSQYEIYASSLDNVSISGNTLKIGEQAKTVSNGEIKLLKKHYTQKVTLIYYNGDSQKLIRSGVLDPVVSLLNVNVAGGHVSIKKLDRKTGITPQGDASLNGAIYNIYDSDNNVVDTLTIGVKETSIDLPTGDYSAKEVSNPKGYKLDDKTYYFTIDKDHIDINLEVYEDVIEVEYNIFKVFANDATVELQGEPGITFEFYLKSSGKLYKSPMTDNTGHLSVILPYGKYLVKQKNTTENYEKVKDFEIDINENTAKVVNKLISDAEIKAKLKVVKVDKDTGKVIAKEGIKFKIKNLNKNEYVCQDITYPTVTRLCVFETDNTGTMVTPYVLNAGNYQLEEVENQKIKGYTWNSEPLKFSINSSSDLKEIDGVQVLEVKFSNKQVKGSLEVNKVGENVVVKDNKLTYEETPLSDVTYELYANEDIYSQDGTLIHNKNDIIRTLRTTDGIAKTSDLYLGKYCLREKSVDSKYVLDNTPHCFKIEYKDQYTANVVMTFTFKNYLVKSDVEITKTDLVDNEPIPNTTISIYTEDNKKIFSDKTSSTGKITFKSIPYGRYYILETKQENGYLLNEDKIWFEVKEDGKVIKSTMTNDRVLGKITLHKDGEKYSIKEECEENTNCIVYETEKNLEGIKFGLYAKEDIILNNIVRHKKDDLVKTGITNSNGDIVFDSLFLGKYYVKELETKDNYVLDTKTYDIELKYTDGKTPLITSNYTLKNYLKKSDFELSKLDIATSEPVEGALIEIYTIDNELVYKGRTSSDGKIYLESLYIGKYQYFESDSPEGYVLNDEIHYFEITEDGTVIKDTLSNRKITSEFELYKTDLANGEPINGALFEIYDEDGNVIYSDYTDETGKINTQLTYGKYSWREVEAPKGYILNDETHYFEVTEDGVIIKFDVTNELEEVEVPNTRTDSGKIIICGGLSLAIIGGGMVIYAIAKKKKKR